MTAQPCEGTPTFIGQFRQLHIRGNQAIIEDMDMRFVVRGSLLAVTIVALAMAAAVALIGPGKLYLPPEATPPRPTILAPRGELPTGPVGLVEYTRYEGDGYHPVGCGFLLSVPGDDVTGVTTAHSLFFSSSDPLQSIALGMSGHGDYVSEFDTLRGVPGQARSGEDMSVDYVLMQRPPHVTIDPALILGPDSRGLPQPGERVTMYSCLGAKTYEGVVQSASDQAVWVLMDESFEPSGMSGSPFLSQHTGKVVGMAIATTHRAGRVLLGLHPIGSLVKKAEVVAVFPRIRDYRR